MNKKTLWITGLILVVAVAVAAVYMDAVPSELTANSIKQKSKSSESSMTSSNASASSDDGGGGSSSSPGGGSSSGGSSSSCAYQCCGDADCASADGLSYCDSDHTCQLKCTAPSGAAECDEGAKCNEQSGNCDEGCGSTFCPLGTSCVNDVYCAPNPPEPPGACTMTTQCADGLECINGTCSTPDNMEEQSCLSDSDCPDDKPHCGESGFCEA